MTIEQNEQSVDKRSINSRNSIRNAFVDLVLSQRYDDFSVGDIIARSGVARSTFYQHFTGKDNVLANSILPPMSRLADAIETPAELQPIEDILLHFWQNRSFCRLILQGTAGRAVNECLTRLIEQRIIRLLADQQKKLLIDVHHAATQIAQAQLSLLRTWLSGKAKTDAATLAQAMKNTSVAMLMSLLL